MSEALLLRRTAMHLPPRHCYTYSRDPWPWGQPHEAAGLHHAARRHGSGVAARGARPAGAANSTFFPLTTSGITNACPSGGLWTPTLRPGTRWSAPSPVPTANPKSGMDQEHVPFNNSGKRLQTLASSKSYAKLVHLWPP